MRRASLLAATFALASLGASARAQEPLPATAVDTTAERGRRDGRAAASAASTGYYAVVGLLTGFIGGAAAPAVWAQNGPATGAATFVPLGLTIAAAARATGASPPPGLAGRIQLEPAAYQTGFRAAYAQHLSRRRRRAAIIGGAAGAVAGFAAFIALGFGALVTAGT